MPLFQFGSWALEINPEGTRAAYAAIAAQERCNCSGCRNYDLQTKVFPEAVRLFFESLGVDPCRPTEIYDLCMEDGLVRYGGFYHLAGCYLSGEDCWQPAPNPLRRRGLFFRQRKLRRRMEDLEHLHQEALPSLAEHFSVGFTRGISMQPAAGWPEDEIVQMEIDFRLPWLLEEPYEQ
ncbi:MAG: hypothetical protein LBJ11_02275 [Oscillospiraceae bacterium]|nr:hypothetical protein [Oscillospiraceae bacterium]